MKKFLLLFLIIVNISSGDRQELKEQKNILILFALSPNQPGYRFILDGIRQKLTAEFGESYTLHTEYLEVQNYPAEKYPKARFDLYNQKYRDIKLDLLICIGMNVIDPVKKYADEYLLKLPVISLDFSFPDSKNDLNLSLNKQTAVMALEFNTDKTITYALSLFPERSTIYFVSGVSPFDKIIMSFSKEAAKKIPGNKKITFLTDLSMDEVLKKLRLISPESIVFLASFSFDTKLVPYFNPEAVRLIRREANVPVFVYTSTGMGDGALGGPVLSFNKVGLYAGDAAVKILNGADPNSIKLPKDYKDYYEYIFDWRELKHWNLENSDLIPSESTILFEEKNFIKEYKWYIGPAFVFLILQTILIIKLIGMNRHQKSVARRMLETEALNRKLLHEDRILSLGQLTASLAHELNQPLTAILSNAQAAIRFINSGQGTPDLLKEILQKIVDGDKRTAAILNSIRTMLRQEEREKEIVDLNALIQEVADVYRSEAVRFNKQLIIELPERTAYVSAVRIQIQQIILNLILNAAQSIERSKTENKKIFLTQHVNHENVTVSVRDFGEGIDEALKPDIFKPFVTSTKEGTGIGLAICRSIIENHEGKIWAENKPDGGAEFSFSLKICKNE
ncbi:MAG: ATP-binding protein [Ignavibacteria bacterium]